MSVTEQAEQEAPKRGTKQVIDELAKGEKPGPGKQKVELEDGEKQDALEWFLAAEDDTDLTHTFQINVGGPTEKKWVDWTIKPVDMDRLRRIRQKAQQQQSRRSRAQGEFDGLAANVAIVVEGTVSPDLRTAAKQLNAIEPGMVVRSRFAHKPGLLDQIAGEIMSLSGYDDDDVREVDAAQG